MSEQTGMQMSNYYLGVDGGGSKTLAIIVDAEGNECGRGLAGSSNYTGVGRERAVAHILQAVSQAKDAAGDAIQIKSAWLGLAGVDRPEDHDLLMPSLQLLAESVQITNDAVLMLGPFQKSGGIALIAGTGSIAFGQSSKGQNARAGGWGYLLGDEGSGYTLALQGLQAAVQAADGRTAPTLLLDLILQAWHLTAAEQIISKIYDNVDRAEIARLSTSILAAARQGDGKAQEIVAQGARDLALQTLTVSKKLAMEQEPLNLALGGGLLLHESDYRERVLAEIRQGQEVGQVELIEQPALSAAQALASQE